MKQRICDVSGCRKESDRFKIIMIRPYYAPAEPGTMGRDSHDLCSEHWNGIQEVLWGHKKMVATS